MNSKSGSAYGTEIAECSVEPKEQFFVYGNDYCSTAKRIFLSITTFLWLNDFYSKESSVGLMRIDCRRIEILLVRSFRSSIPVEKEHALGDGRDLSSIQEIAK
eukprot:TRINITY_DN7485_c0_g1_i14.p1 TRINITY_DN7485_c0_g1~~TRINITY_DN7485_c0_g1_i14.p1  ORF type:complete len:103 (+),score=19.98 TRINITY_DN7485_c0_g1_i14:556-864(+)